VPPQLVKRVHELYEELGREDVRAVEDWDKAQQKFGNGGIHSTDLPVSRDGNWRA